MEDKMEWKEQVIWVWMRSCILLIYCRNDKKKWDTCADAMTRWYLYELFFKYSRKFGWLIRYWKNVRGRMVEVLADTMHRVLWGRLAVVSRLGRRYMIKNCFVEVLLFHRSHISPSNSNWRRLQNRMTIKIKRWPFLLETNDSNALIPSHLYYSSTPTTMTNRHCCYCCCYCNFHLLGQQQVGRKAAWSLRGGSRILLMRFAARIVVTMGGIE